MATIALAGLFNVPYGILAATYDYPAILRRPPGEALDLFAAGGTGLILTWHGFAWAAFAFIPLAMALALVRLPQHPALATAAAVIGALAGLTQAIGLWRWVFVVPGLAQAHAAPGAPTDVMRAAEHAFGVLNQYGGVAIGEHTGQLLTALFVLLLARLQAQGAQTFTAWAGFATAALIAFGTGEGVAIATGFSGVMFGLGTIAGFLGLSLWLALTGAGHLRRP